MAFAPRAVVDGPPRLPLPYGLFSVVSLAEASTERWENGVTWLGASCDPVAIVVGDCDAPEGFPKQFPDGGGVVGEASAFTVYGTYKCSPSGNAVSEGQRQAREVLIAREEAAVERRLWDSMDDDPTVLAGGDPLVTLALLERFIGDEYGSLGVIHASRFAAAILVVKGLISGNGKQMQTALGTPVVVGTGYPGTGVDGVAPPDASEYIAATPAMFGYRSQIFESTNRPGDLLDRTSNDLYGIAERNYLIGYDNCGVAFAPVTLTE